LAIACGDDSQGGGTLPGGQDAANDKTSQGDRITQGDTGNPPSDAGDGGTAADCGFYRIFTNDSGPFCGVNAPDGAPSNCNNGQVCCQCDREAGTPSSCQANAAACTCIPSNDAGNNFNAIWECNEKNDCPANQVCCLSDTPIQDNTCSTKYFSTRTLGTTCKANCAAGEAVVCGSQADCTTGTCVGARIKSVQLGFCK
jgi:hypothetical protein